MHLHQRHNYRTEVQCLIRGRYNFTDESGNFNVNPNGSSPYKKKIDR